MSPSRGPWRDAYRFNNSREYYTDVQDFDQSGYSYGGSRRSAATSGRERNYNYRRGYHHTAPRYDQEESWPQRQRRASPVYEDYAGPSSSVPSGPSSSLVYGENSAPPSSSSAPSRPPSSRRSQPPRNEPQRPETSPPLPPSYDYAHEEYQESSYSSYTTYSDRRGERMRFAPPPPRPRRSASPESQSQNLILCGPSISLRVSPLRSPTPPPLRKTAPTEEYLSASLQPSTRIPDPTQERKLIVLDLNGSLLLRSQHKPRNGGQGGGKPFNPYDPSIPPIQRGLRTVHPRPYLSPFISYLFHPETKKWLDTMVWSSAQPHSVDDMVQKCFKERRGGLKAVWARDTLGLTGNEYNQKTQTTKDLEKPWSSLFSTSQSASPPSPPPPPAIKAPPKPTQHSAKSTLLVDDSPLKAILQPWNHLCIQEYTQELRRVDLETVDWEWEQRERVREALMRERKEEREKEKERKMLERLGVSVAPWEETGAGSKAQKSATAGEGESDGDGEVEKGEEGEGEEAAEKKLNSAARRKLKRLAKKHEARLSSATTTSLPSSSSFLSPSEGEGEKVKVGAGEAGEEVQAQTQPKEYDTTLLAVIGILDHLKYENNVAGWMRAGGLLGVPGVPGVPASVSVPLPAGADDLEEGEISSAAATASEIIPTVLSLEGTHTPPTLEEQGREKRRRVSGAEEGAGVASSEAAEAEAEIQEYEEQALTGVPTSSEHDHEHKHNLSKSEKGSAHKQPKPHSHPQFQLQSEPEAEQPPSAAIAPLWYEHPAAQAYWAQRGREALLALGIEVESGIERVPGGLQ